LLHHTIQEQVLAYEELNTVFHRIESILNSRPLGAMSSDPNDLQTLTAGHFLTMEPLVTVPVSGPTRDLDFRYNNDGHLCNTYKIISGTEWSKEYLHTISVRSKWGITQCNLEPGDLVIIKEPTPPLTWKIAQVIEVHPEKDKIVRLATVRTANRTILKRPVVKLCRLPLVL